MFHAASRLEMGGATDRPRVMLRLLWVRDALVLLAAHDPVFRYCDRGEPILWGCSLQVYVRPARLQGAHRWRQAPRLPPC